MRNAPHVLGVPTPFRWQNKVPGTRFHVGRWTQPVFGMPKIATPSYVFTPSYNTDRELPQNTVSGLGDVNYDTGEGVFRPGGYGGGVFDGNIAGLGALNPKPTKSLGILSSLFSNEEADYPWKAYSEKTKALQQEANLRLIAKQKCPIVVDGKLGPGTCGAVKFVGGTPPSTCQSFTDPAPLTASCATANSGGTVVTSTPTAPVLPSAGMSSSTKRAIGFALGGALAIGAVLVLKKKR